MRLRIQDKWATAFDDRGDHRWYLGLSVHGAAAERMLVSMSTRAARLIAPEDPQHLTEPVLMLLLDRFSHLGVDGLAPLLKPGKGGPTYSVDLAEDDAALAKRLAERKACKYQAAENGELFCNVTTSLANDTILVWPTTRHRCGKCPVPDSRLACSNFCHARVQVRPESAELAYASCELDREQIKRDRSACRPGGHECWEREVEIETAPDEAQHALTLHELLELVDARWKSAFRAPLVSSRRGTAFGKLATPCETAADLEGKLSALAHVMKGFEISDSLLQDEHRGRDEYKEGSNLKRMESALERALGDDVATVAAVKKALTVLREANRLRNGAQHGGDVVSQYARFGLPYPPPPAPETWARIVSKVAQALHELAAAIPD